MTGKLTRLPKLWFVECSYCQTSPTKDRHEQELRTLATRLCQTPKTSRILDYLNAELDRMDHANLNHQTQVEIITEIHKDTGCTCLNDLTQKIQDQLTAPPTLSSPTSTSTTQPTAALSSNALPEPSQPHQATFTSTPTPSPTPAVTYLPDTPKKQIAKALKSTRHIPAPPSTLLSRLTTPKPSKPNN